MPAASAIERVDQCESPVGGVWPSVLATRAIRKLRQSKHHKVAVPWMVLEEMAAHQAHLYPVKHQSVLNTLEKLRDILPWELESSLEPLDLERYLDHWRGSTERSSR
ncbi:hypothetical protein [Streptomyces hokutonensis]|uniref:hypothetical protein n=1 Tax=Streptomyces hokutonensis TaxID=1306990 RepID=UPI0033F051BB